MKIMNDIEQIKQAAALPIAGPDAAMKRAKRKNSG